MLKALSALICAFSLAHASQTFPREHILTESREASDRGIAELKYIRKSGHGPYNNGTHTNSTISAISSTSILSTTSTTVTTTSPTNSTSVQYNSTTTSQESCSGSVTYTASVPPTVYATITQGFAVTVTASNASLPPAETITPLVACTAAVIPLAGSGAESSVNSACPYGVCYPGFASQSSAVPSFQPALTVITLSLAPAIPGTSVTQNVPQGVSKISETPAPAPSTGSAFTSTVFVTKKTPVPVVVPPSSNPPVFQIPSTTKNPATTPKPGGSAVPAPPLSSNVATGKAPVSNPPVVSEAPTTTQIGNIIASIINSPFTPVNPDSTAPITTSIDNVPVEVLPSSVVIGGQVLSLPATSSETTLQVNGQTFTVQNSQIIAPGTTYAITPERDQEAPATAAPSPVTAGGLTFSVGATQAIISGTTYAIGNGAGSSTTVKVGSETLTIGSSGVILPSTTVAPIKITAAPLAPETITAGGMTFTVGPSYAVVSGTSYTIGPGAKSTTIVVGGKTISIGSNGIGLASTTIAPEPNFSVVTVGGMTISVDSSEAILSGTTYKIGKGAPTETTVVGGKTISLGPSGVGLPSTTIPPETAPTGALQGRAASFSIGDWPTLSALLVGIGAILL